MIHHDKAYLQHCLEEMKKVCESLGIVLNPKKTQIVKLTRGMTFLKTRFNLTDTGRVIRKPNKRSITVMRRKLKVFRRWVSVGKFTYLDARTSYCSWKGHLARCNSYRTIQAMDALFIGLFLIEAQVQAGGNIYL